MLTKLIQLLGKRRSGKLPLGFKRKMQVLHFHSACICYLQLSPEDNDFLFSFAFKSLLSSSQKSALNKNLASERAREMSFLGHQSLHRKETLEAPAKMVAANMASTLQSRAASQQRQSLSDTCQSILLLYEHRGVHLHKPRQHSLLSVSALRYSLWLLGCKAVQHVPVQNNTRLNQAQEKMRQ